MPAVPPVESSAPPRNWRHLAVLLLGVLGVFGGQAWLLGRGEAPLMALLQNEELTRRLVENRLGVDWNTWVSDPAINRRIADGLHAAAWGFVCCALCAVALPLVGGGRPARWLRRALGAVVLAGSGALAALAWLSYLDHNQVALHYLEHSTQVITPVVWVLALAGGSRLDGWPGWLARIALACTFAIHGLYAIGLEVPGSATLAWSLPGSWTEMTVNGLGKAAAIVGAGPPDEQAAAQFLRHIGILDLVAAAAVLLPVVGNAALAYMAGWGLLTAIARTWLHFIPEFAAETLAQWLPETLVRLPHFALPMFLLAARIRPARCSPPADPPPR